MSNVKLEIGGRHFTVACAEGEEDHVTGLGEMIATKIATMGDVTGQSESRMLLFAALLLADELHDANSRTGGANPQPGLSPASAQKLDAIAERLENLASRLEG
ncbi:MAG: cell division protein ZapA [Novosphingobium sp.]|nr:MAG: cell division protein ZapA [Novosphingobium sp.]